MSQPKYIYSLQKSLKYVSRKKANIDREIESLKCCSQAKQQCIESARSIALPKQFISKLHTVDTQEWILEKQLHIKENEYVVSEFAYQLCLQKTSVYDKL